jgi:beta-galactosidase
VGKVLNIGKFLFGFSESGFQFEMGLPGSEDPNSDWWIWVHDKDNIFSGIVSGDYPENGVGYWDLYRIDHRIASFLGMKIARIGIEWSRIFPKPTTDVKTSVSIDEIGNITHVDVSTKTIEELDKLANKQAVNKYMEIFKDWKENHGGKLILNLYHWTMPKWLHNPILVRSMGPDRAPAGWISKTTIVEFAKFAAYIAYKFDEVVDAWSLMNEPNVVYMGGYMGTGFPPGIVNSNYMFRVALNLIEACARASDSLKQYSKKPVGLIHAIIWFEPFQKDNVEDQEATEKAKMYWQFGFIDALTKGSSVFTNNIKRDDLENKIDWIGVNYYSRHVIRYQDNALGYKPVHGYGFACGSQISRDNRPCSDIGWEFYPEGLYYSLKESWKRYNLPMLITENGIADSNDRLRPKYIVSHIQAVYNAIKDGVNIQAYLHWALTDNYEWGSGFGPRFGIVEVDYSTKKRKIRPSGLVFKEIAENGFSILEELEWKIGG